MIEATVDAGACGFTNIVKANRKGLGFKVKIETKCKLVEKFAEDIETLDKDVVFKKMPINPVYQKADILHAVCPVPCGVLKACEAEAGFAIKKSVKIDLEEKEE
ncbi:MAG: hypothetical protein APG12_00897 [Candidatus Methanofastidiosum methylothiophilum]|uniref:Uncharacterized protein n=1 Tax=Candidatus Methanofastidiosum methylothiophilum TaxID=1705564 RepID=A0A150IS91_9EURY|nr:MAG: hypothetical protein APG10_00711 [Candidatus Methanofastidiosum methylthiophilus]KYC47715.1 MAG: hypothetical protein APG11_00961 [Candidatus Methanofastidiosum methylthiophilus]KYC50279.1 MAG: hypothetical protein APG12_00897 [Candidatus Methanofastidiosum methylthiophilus]